MPPGGSGEPLNTRRPNVGSGAARDVDEIGDRKPEDGREVRPAGTGKNTADKAYEEEERAQFILRAGQMGGAAVVTGYGGGGDGGDGGGGDGVSSSLS